MNRLINETSPYLLQHAHNPVDWYPWGEEALQLAKERNLPILVSIGYAACHWCHVMERESFENEETAAYMNSHFVNIKIDREERPDLDHIYMDAVQAMAGNGGWPLNVFLTPDARPFYGGTYFPPRPAFNRPSWMDVLKGVQEAFSSRRNEIDAQAENLTAHLAKANAFGQAKPAEGIISNESTRVITENMLKSADREWGGFGQAPKFPQTFSIRYLLRYAWENRKEGNSLADEGLAQALLSLDKMIYGGLYDQVGGGFARYSTDREWLAPHFEKMLYDNALLVSVLSEAFQWKGNREYARVIDETMEFLDREMTHPGGGWYAALDADSEGEEGKFYVWNLEEIEKILGTEAPLFSTFYDITDKGNWEGKNILRIRQPLEEFAKQKGLKADALSSILSEGKKRLLVEREKRPRPLLDDKIILGWNALMNSAATGAFAATGNPGYLKRAVRNMEFLLDRLREGEGPAMLHSWKENARAIPAFLDDYSSLVQALLDLHEHTGDPGWLGEATRVTDHVLKNFSEEEGPYFFYTHAGQQDVILRKKEVYDGALPSGNALMAGNLWRLSIYLDRPEWNERAVAMISSLGPAITKYPTSFGQWACSLLEATAGTMEIAITGPDFQKRHEEIIQYYLPHCVIQSAEIPNDRYPLLAGKEAGGDTSIWLCRDYTCQAPVFSVDALITLINREGTA